MSEQAVLCFTWNSLVRLLVPACRRTCQRRAYVSRGTVRVGATNSDVSRETSLKGIQLGPAEHSSPFPSSGQLVTARERLNDFGTYGHSSGDSLSSRNVDVACFTWNIRRHIRGSGIGMPTSMLGRFLMTIYGISSLSGIMALPASRRGLN